MTPSMPTSRPNPGRIRPRRKPSVFAEVFGVRGLWFAIAGAICWGAAPIFSKVGLVRLDPALALSVRSFAVSLVLAAYLTASGSWSGFAHLPAKSALLIVAEGILAALLGQFFYYQALKHWEVSKVSPIMAVFPAITVALAFALLGEKLTVQKMAGTALILAGVWLVKG